MKMTIDKAISWLEELTFHEGEDVPIYDTDVEAIKMGIKALKRESVIDKITEIIDPLRHLSIDEMSGIEWDILQVIDKYKAESKE
jgi:hypothetical protein